MEKKLFPAHAGVILVLHGQAGLLEPFPRRRGGDPFNACLTVSKAFFSLPTRG